MAQTEEKEPPQANPAIAERARRMEEISRGVDGRRSHDLEDVSGDKVTGRFQEGALDDSPEAREAAAEAEERQAAIALQEAADKAAENEGKDDQLTEEQRSARAIAAAQEEAEGRARSLQEEGTGDATERDGSGQSDRGELTEGDEKVIDGKKYYATAVNGEIKWLTLRELREGVSRGIATEEALQAAQDALQRATDAALTPKAAPAPDLSDEELRAVILSAGMGDDEAVAKLASVIKARQSAPDETSITRLVSQRIATQRAIDQAEADQAEILDNEVLAPIFRQRWSEFIRDPLHKRLKITDGYRVVGEGIRKDFAPMLKPRSPGIVPGSKADRKRTLVSPPHGAARAAPTGEDEREPPVSSVIDEIAKGRGQGRAIRQEPGRR